MTLDAMAFYNQAQGKLNDLINSYQHSTCRPIDYTSKDVLSRFNTARFGPATTQGIDDYDPSSPFSYIHSFVDNKRNPVDLTHQLFTVLDIHSIKGLADLWALLRPCHISMCSDYIPSLIKSGVHPKHDIPIEAQLLLEETHGMFLYSDQATNLLDTFFSLTKAECNQVLVNWKKGKNTDIWITPKDYINLTDAEKVFRLVSTRASKLFSRGHAISKATYHYKQMFLKVHSPELFEEWQSWLTNAYSDIEDVRVYIQIDLN